MKSPFRSLAAAMLLACLAFSAKAGELTIAAAADLKYAMAEIADAFRAAHPGDKVEVVYGSSGKFHTQIQNGAPFDLFFSADIAYPKELEKMGLAASITKPYAFGRIVLWSPKPELSKLPLKSLPSSPAIRKFAIANPDHAPYGRRAQEALEHENAWEALKPKLVLGENIAHTAQFVDSGAADVGIVALSLAKSPSLAGKGSWTLIPAEWHQPLEQGYVVTARAKNTPLAKAFAQYMELPAARAVMRRYGFVLPGEEGK